MQNTIHVDNLTGPTDGIGTPEVERPRKIEQFFQGADDPTVAVMAERMAAEDYSDNLLIAGPSGSGKTSLMRAYGSRRCCDVAQDANHGCGVCRLCRTIFTGGRMQGVGYNELRATNRDWHTRLKDLVEVANGPITVAGGNRRALPPVIAIDEVHVLNKQQQLEVARLIENSPGCFLFATTEPDRLIIPLVSLCRRLEMKPPTHAQFTRSFARLLTERAIDFDPEVPALFFQACGGNVRDCIGQASALSKKQLARWAEREVRQHLGLPTYLPLGWY